MAPESRAAVSPASPASDVAPPPRFLLIDDDEADRMAVRRALAQVHFHCVIVECATAAAAIQQQSGDFDCVLLDYLLPGTTAMELLPNLKRWFPRAAIVVLTGHGDEQIAVALMKAGAADYISKDRLDGYVLSKMLHRAFALQAARTKVERAEEAGRLYTSMLHDLAEAAPELYGGTTLEERLGAAARVACRLLAGVDALVELRSGAGVQFAHARGDEVTAPHAPDERWRAAFIETSRADTPQRSSTVPWDADSDEVVVRQPLRDREGHVVGFLGVRRATPPDELVEFLSPILAQVAQTLIASVENLRLYETAKKAVESRDAVMAVVSHDLRSPLSAMALGIEILSDSPTPEQAATVLDRMERSKLHMKRLINDLLDVAQIDSGRFQVTPQRDSVSSILDEARALVAAQAEQAGLELVVDAPTGLEVYAHRHRLVQVLSNLLGNAIKFTPSGGVVSIRAARADGGVQFAVKDTGPGIEPAQLPHVFERYWRKDRRGLGLGLFIAEAIVVAHGGRIWVESVPGEGATFTFSLPDSDGA